MPLHHTLARHVPRAARFSLAPRGAAQGRTRTRPSAPVPFARGAGTTLTSAAAPRVATPSGVPRATRSQAASRPGRNWSSSTEGLRLPCPSATSEPRLVQGRVSWPPRGRRPQPRTELRCQPSAERNLWPCGHAARPRPRNFLSSERVQVYLPRRRGTRSRQGECLGLPLLSRRPFVTSPQSMPTEERAWLKYP